MRNQETIVIFGATSALAQAVAKIHADNGDSIILVARNQEHQESIATDLRVRGAGEVSMITADLANVKDHPELLAQLRSLSTNIHKYYFFYGVLPNQEACQQSWPSTLEALNTNFLSKVSLLSLLANQIEQETNRSLIVVSSVAGDRGRQSNYVYGAGKGALSIFLQGLRNRLQKANCSVITIKPGFIDTPMTKDFDKGGLLWASPEKVAKDIVKAGNKNKDVVYSPWFWRYIMLIIKLIPERIFKKLNL